MEALMQVIATKMGKNGYIISSEQCIDNNNILIYDYGEFITILGDINLNDLANKINFKFKVQKGDVEYNQKSVSGYIEKCYQKLIHYKYDPVVTTLLLNEIEKLFQENIECLSNDKLNSEMNLLFQDFALLQIMVSNYVDGKLSQKTFQTMPQLQTIQARFFLSEDGTIQLLFSLIDIYSLIILDIFNVKSKNIMVKRCENCGKFFIPQNRSDEIYCDRIYKNGKTCKQIGYFEKEKADPFKKLFTTARKTQYARIGYNKHIKDYRDKHYKPWLEAAQKAKEKFEVANDIDGFRKWIEDNKNSF